MEETLQTWRLMKDVDHKKFAIGYFSDAKDCYSVFIEDKGILIILGRNSTICMKFAIINNFPMLQGANRTGHRCTSIALDSRNTYLLTAQGDILQFFSSYKSITPVDESGEVKHLECFNKSCYILLRQKRSLMLQICTPGDEKLRLRCEFDLSFPEDPVSSHAQRNEKFCFEMLEGPLKKADVEFFNVLLACDLNKESIHDVLLMSIDEKLYWVKYKDHYSKQPIEYDIEIITTIKNANNIRALKYLNEKLIILDSSSMLTIIYRCPNTNLSRKVQFHLERKVVFFKFVNNFFIYSTLRQVIFIDISNYSHLATTHTVNLKGIVTFAVIENHNFIIAICCNRMFYYLPINFPTQQQKKNDEFVTFDDEEIEKIPEVEKFLENEETKVEQIEEKYKEAQKHLTFLQQLEGDKNFKAGSAVIKFHPSYPNIPGVIIRSPVSHNPAAGWIELEIEFPQSITAMSFRVLFARYTNSGVVQHDAKITNADSKASFVIPAESGDNPNNRMELSVIFDFDGDKSTHPTLNQFPIDIKKVEQSDNLNASIESCKEGIETMDIQ